MKRIKLTVAYDGTNYHGWQIQPGRETIEGVLNRELFKLLHEDIKVIGASRTDSGVHALANIAVFDTETRIPPTKLAYALNQGLPKDIRIRASEEVAADFHPRKTESVKIYEYKILNDTIEMPTLRLYTYFTYTPLNVTRMSEAAAYLVGTHDFKSFCSVNTDVDSTVRTLHSVQVSQQENIITMRVAGNGFLYNMVRIIAGTLMEVGRERFAPEEIRQILAAKDRSAAGPTAPARGLTLISYHFFDKS